MDIGSALVHADQFVYVMERPDGLYKIGRSWHIGLRRGAMTRAEGVDVFIRWVMHTGDAVGTERLLHERYADKRVRGEWFRLTDGDLAEIERSGPSVPHDQWGLTFHLRRQNRSKAARQHQEGRDDG